MAKRIITDYTFSATGQSVTLTNPEDTPIDLKRLLMIVNQTRGVVIFSAFEPGKDASLNANDIELSFDTTLHADTDILTIWYDDPTGEEVLVESISSMRMAIQALNRSIGMILPWAGATTEQGSLPVTIRNANTGTLNTITSVGTVTTVTAVTAITNALPALTNQTQMGGFQAADQIPALMSLAAKALRNNISVAP